MPEIFNMDAHVQLVMFALTNTFPAICVRHTL